MRDPDRAAPPALGSGGTLDEARAIFGAGGAHRRGVGRARGESGRLLRHEASGRLLFMRWNEHKSAQFQTLRDAEARGRLTEAERATLDGLLADLDADEAEALQAAGERLDPQARAMDAEKAELDLKAKELERIAWEEDALLAEARAFVARLRHRSAILAEDFRRVTGRKIAPAQ